MEIILLIGTPGRQQTLERSICNDAPCLDPLFLGFLWSSRTVVGVGLVTHLMALSSRLLHLLHSLVCVQTETFSISVGVISFGRRLMLLGVRCAKSTDFAVLLQGASQRRYEMIQCSSPTYQDWVVFFVFSPFSARLSLTGFCLCWLSFSA